MISRFLEVYSVCFVDYNQILKDFGWSRIDIVTCNVSKINISGGSKFFQVNAFDFET